MVMFDPIQCVATPVDTDTGQPRPSYERPFIPIDIQDEIKEHASAAVPVLPKEGIHHCNEEIVQIQKSKNDGNILKIVNSPSEDNSIDQDERHNKLNLNQDIIVAKLSQELYTKNM